MAHKKQGQLTTSGAWARHLRPLLRRWFWKGERRAAKEMICAEDNYSGPALGDGSVEGLLAEVAQWPADADAADLWVPATLTLEGRAVPQDVAMAIVGDRALSRSFFPNGFSPGNGGRLYHYKRE